MGLALHPQEIFCLEGLDGLKNKKIKKKTRKGIDNIQPSNWTNSGRVIKY